jgi:hypothetical protein
MSLTYPQIQALTWLDSFGPHSKKDCNDMGHTQRVLASLQVKRMITSFGVGNSQMHTVTQLGNMYAHNLRVVCDNNLTEIANRTGTAREAHIVRLGKQVAIGLGL